MDKPINKTCIINALYLAVIVAVSSVCTPLSWANSLANDTKLGLYVHSIDEVLQLDDDQIDIATAALIVSEKWSDVVHGFRYRDRLDEMAQEIKKRLQEQKLRPNFRAIPVINDYLFEELGFSTVADANNPEDLFLHSVLDNRKGYCLSLSILYLSLAERLDIPLYGVVVPGHFFVRYDSRSTRFNIETTARGATGLTDKDYIERYNVPQDRTHGLYLKNLTKLQSLGCLFNNFGVVYLEKEQYDHALQALDLAVRINPMLSEARTNLANIYLRQGQLDLAIDQLRAAIAINPNDAKIHCLLGKAYLEKDQGRLAIAELNRSLQIDPNMVEGYLHLAIAFQRQKRYQEAKQILVQAIDLFPDHAPFYVELGNVHHLTSNYDMAIPQYQKAIRLQPDMLQAYFGLGLSYSQLGRLDEEIEAFKKVLSIEPKTFVALANLGRVYLLKENYPTAIGYIAEAIAVDPSDPDLFYQLGTAYLRNNQTSEAIKALHKALEMNPQMGESHYNLAVCYYNLKLFDLAWDHMNEAKRLGMEVTQEQLDTIDRQRHIP